MNNQSIHPRVSNGRTLYDKVNTRKSVNRDRLKVLISRMEEHIGRHPLDEATKAHINKIKAI